MNVRRFEHPGKHKFWEIYWEGGDVEMVSGTIGTKGRASRVRGGLRGSGHTIVEIEIAQRLREGFVEVHPEVAEAAPQAAAAPEWISRIAEAYDDDAPRLVYADWLQQQGDPLGEFIMLQCERARLERWDTRQKAMREREEHMLALYRSRWLPNLASANVDFERGFVERIRIVFPTDLDVFESVVEVAPLARTLEISSEPYTTRFAPEALDPLELGRFTGLYVRGVNLQRAHLDRWLADPGLAEIDRFGLAGCGLGGGDLKALATREFRELDLHQNTLGVRGTQYALASAPALVDLDLGNAAITDGGAQLVAEASLPKLQRLWLRRAALTHLSLVPLLGARNLPALRLLELSGNALDRASIEAVCACTLPSLLELDLSACSLGDDAAIALSQSPLLKRLAWLDLGHNVIGLAGAKALTSVELPALRFLDVSGTAMGQEVAALKDAHRHARVVARAK